MNTRLRERDHSKSMLNQKMPKNDVKVSKMGDGKLGPKQLTIAEATPLKTTGEPNAIMANSEANAENDVLTELRKLRKENTESFQDLKTSFTRMENKLMNLQHVQTIWTTE